MFTPRRAVVVSLLSFASTPSLANADDLRTGFPMESSNNGPWRLGWQVGPAGALRTTIVDIDKGVLYWWSATSFEAIPAGQPCPSVASRVPAPSTGLWTTAAKKKTGDFDLWPGPVGQTFVGSGPCDLRGVVQYTVPASGRYVVEFTRFVADFSDGADVALRVVNGPTLVSETRSPFSGAATFVTTIQLAAGARLQLSAGNASSQTDQVGVDLRIDAVPQGDLNGDSLVNAADLASLLGSWGACATGGHCPADLDGDGAVGPSDLASALGSWTS